MNNKQPCASTLGRLNLEMGCATLGRTDESPEENDIFQQSTIKSAAISDIPDILDPENYTIKGI